MKMRKPRFDPNAAFRNIVGLTETAELGGDESSGYDESPQGLAADSILIIGSKGKEETRSKRVNLVVKPSVYNMAKAKCDSINISINECVNQFLEKWGRE